MSRIHVCFSSILIRIYFVKENKKISIVNSSHSKNNLPFTDFQARFSAQLDALFVLDDRFLMCSRLLKS